LDQPENEHLHDLTPRELWVVLPLLAGMVWLGLYPKPVLSRMEASSERYVQLVKPALDQPEAPAEKAVAEVLP